LWTVRRIAVEYLKPARLDDSLIVVTRSLDISGARVRLAQEIRRGSESLITGVVEACLVSGGKPRRIPEDIRARMEKISA